MTFDFDNGFRPSKERVAGELERRRRLAANVVKFGISYLDDYCIGIHPTDLVIVCASSGAGKTSIAALIAQIAASAGKRVHFFALEAHETEIEQRMLFREVCDVLRQRELRPFPTFQQWFYDTVRVPDDVEEEARRRFEARVEGMFTFYRGEKFTADDITRRFAEVRASTDLIILDHLHYVDSDDGNENRAFKDITKAIRDAALAMEKPVIAIAHLRKRDRSRPRIIPELDDVHGGSDIVKIATKVIALAPARDRQDSDPSKANTYMQVIKDRFPGVSGYAALCAYDLRTMRYAERYVIGRLSAGGDAFENVADYAKPAWATRGMALGTEPPTARAQ